MTKPGVLQLIETFNQGGSERQAVQLTRLLCESGKYHVQVACLDGCGVLRGEIEALGLGEISAYPLTSFHDANFAAQLHRFARYLRANKVSLLHTHDYYTNIFGMAAAALARVPVRIAVRRESGKRAALKRRVERGAYKLAQAVIANCDMVRRELLAEGVPESKLVVSHNGIDLARFAPRPELRREEMLAALGLPHASGRRLVTMVANLRPVKDQATFLRAAQRVRAAVPDAVFCLAGEGELLEPLRQQAVQFGLVRDVFFLGRCGQVAELLAVSEVCVLSSSSEGFSNAILEYMAAGRPVVATDVGGAREAVIEGQTGHLVRAGDAEAMASWIISLLCDPARARALGECGRRVTEQKFSCGALLERTEHLYDSLLSALPASSRQFSGTVGKEIERVSR